MLAQFILEDALVRSDVVEKCIALQLLRFPARRGGPENRETRHRRDAQIEQVRGLQKLCFIALFQKL